MPNAQAQNAKIDQNDNAVAAHLHQDHVGFSFGTLQGFLVNPADNQMWFGAGNFPTSYNITDNPDEHVLTALKVHLRQGPDSTPTSSGPNGEQNYVVPAGLQPGSLNRAAWNLDYGATTDDNPDNTAPLNSQTLGTFDFKMQMTASGGAFAAPKTVTFDLNPANHTWVDEDNPSIAYGGDDFNQPGASASLMDHVSENSINVGFGAFQQAFGQPLDKLVQAGTSYDFKLTGFDGSKLIAYTHDTVSLV